MKKPLLETFKKIGGYRLNEENLLHKQITTDKTIYKELEKFDYFDDLGIDQEGGGLRKRVTIHYTTGADAEGDFAEVKSRASKVKMGAQKALAYLEKTFPGIEAESSAPLNTITPISG